MLGRSLETCVLKSSSSCLHSPMLLAIPLSASSRAWYRLPDSRKLLTVAILVPWPLMCHAQCAMVIIATCRTSLVWISVRFVSCDGTALGLGAQRKTDSAENERVKAELATANEMIGQLKESKKTLLQRVQELQVTTSILLSLLFASHVYDMSCFCSMWTGPG